jgi:hypothetical protein
VCDVKASECPKWFVGQAGGENHCNASDTPYWRAMKQAHRNAGAAEDAAAERRRLAEDMRVTEERAAKEKIKRAEAEKERAAKERVEQRLAHERGQLERQRELVRVDHYVHHPTRLPNNICTYLQYV